MKKYLYLLFAVTGLFVSCTPSIEEKAKDMMEAAVVKNLVKPNSYEFTSVEVDSCFYGGQISPEMFQFAFQLNQLYNQYKEYKSSAEMAESTLAIYAPSYYDSAFEKQQRKKAQEDFNLASRKKDDCKAKILQLVKDNKNVLIASAQGGGDFTGYYGILTYRAETNGGMMVSGQNLFFFDKDMSKVIASYSEKDANSLSGFDQDIQYEFEQEFAQIFSQE